MERADRELVCATCAKPFVFTAEQQARLTRGRDWQPKFCADCWSRQRAAALPQRPSRGGMAGRGPRPFIAAAPDDPDGYRAPGFSRQPRVADSGATSAAIDDTPQDDERDGQNVMLARYDARADRASRASRGPGTSADRSGTDPNAYRAPGFGTAPRVTRDVAPTRERPQHPIVCADCGANATVPFAPTPGKPTYCADCYGARRARNAKPRGA